VVAGAIARQILSTQHIDIQSNTIQIGEERSDGFSADEIENQTPTSVKFPAQNESPVKVYSISGQYIGTFESADKILVAKKGLYIVNGKKVIIK